MHSHPFGKAAATDGIYRRYKAPIAATKVGVAQNQEILSGAFFWLTAFYFVYCARPADLLPAIGILPLAKITSALATFSLVLSLGRTSRKLSDIPKEAFYLLSLVTLLFISALLSPVWKGGAFFITLDFAKALVIWILTFLLVTSLRRLRRLIFLQSASVALISFAAIVKGHSIPRLQGVIGGFYSNPNDMAFAIVLSIPFCVAFLLTARNIARKFAWAVAVVVMASALMLTASRAGFIDLVIAGGVLLWQFGVKGKRPYLIVGALLLSTVVLLTAGKALAVRFQGILESGNTVEQDSAHESYEERRELMVRAVAAIAKYPVLGVGAGDFVVYSGLWRDVHVTYLQIAVDGGIPVLILYLLFFARGFTNLRVLSQTKNLDDETVLFLGALKSSLVGFVVGACFAPEAYQFFPYFTVCYTSVLCMMVKERERFAVPEETRSNSIHRDFAKAIRV
ncbi:MAG TPA: O-antigen ligase family protein [Candidatus Sulfotelmatobacter sp.]|nr:O-antigen ligase family protein [Candidatus Sulfotelmatobacter sp.]